MNREFRVPGPIMLWVSDFTYVATWKGFAYVAFVIDAYPTAASGVPPCGMNRERLTAMGRFRNVCGSSQGMV